MAAWETRNGEPFGILLRRVRVDVGASQIDVARAAGFTQQAVSMMECWGNGVPESTLRRYAAALGCRVELRLVEDEEY